MFKLYRWNVEYSFHAVGQGLFSTGALTSEHIGAFRWVYDCGTVSEQSLLIEQINRYYQHLHHSKRERPFINLLAISHFDIDHISGIVNLLQHCDVGDLLLPYIPLWQRLVIAFEERSGFRSALTQFLIDPVAFLREASGGTINRIILVMPAAPPADEPEPEPEPQLPDPPDYPEDPEPSDLLSVDALDEDDLQEQSEVSSMISASSSPTSNTRIVAVASGSSLLLSRIWEFVPYNDATMNRYKNKKFENAVNTEAGILKHTTVRAKREAALTRLKESYTRTFGASARRRNIISLFLYAGPIRMRYYHGLNVKYEHARWLPCEKYYLHDKLSLLYTGDGYLKTKKQFDNLSACLNASRLSQLAVFQVMHHGARDNWQSGIADKLTPDYSVFSSDPESKRTMHPHAEVLRDFYNYHPVQVNKEYSATFASGGLYYWPPIPYSPLTLKRL